MIIEILIRMSLRTTPRTTTITSGTTAFSTPALVRTADEKPRSRPVPIEPRPLETDQVIREIEEDINEIQSLESDMEPPPSLEDIKGSTKSLTFFVFFLTPAATDKLPRQLGFFTKSFCFFKWCQDMNGASWSQASTQDFIQSYSRFSLGNLDLIDSIPEDFEFKKLTEKAASDNQTKGYFF